MQDDGQREVHSAGYGPASAQQSRRASRTWWDDQAYEYYREHVDLLGDADLVWGPEGWSEADLAILGPVAGLDVLEFGAGAGQGARWCAHQGACALATDLSGAMLRMGASLDGPPQQGTAPAYVQCDVTDLPLATASIDIAFSAYGALPFLANPAAAMSELARVLRPGGRLAFSVTHPLRWATPDVPGEGGLQITRSYFDRDPYRELDADGEPTYVEHHRTLGDRIRDLRTAGFLLDDLIEPEWPAGADHVWGGWSRLRGELFPGTAIFVARRDC